MVNTMKKALAILCLSLLLLAACGSKAPEAREQPEPTPVVTPSTPAPEAAVESIDQQVAEVDMLTQDLDSGNLDQVDADLAAIDNLDLG